MLRLNLSLSISICIYAYLLYICINECKGADDGTNSEKSANSVICISLKRLFGGAHCHIPHLVAEKVVGI